MKKFPEEIFVTQEEAGTVNEWLQVNETAEQTASIGQKKRVGRYVLQDVVTVETRVLMTTNAPPKCRKS